MSHRSAFAGQVRRLTAFALCTLLCLLFVTAEASAWILYTPIQEGNKHLSYIVPDDMELTFGPYNNPDFWVAGIEEREGRGLVIYFEYTRMSDRDIHNLFDTMNRSNGNTEVHRMTTDLSIISFCVTKEGYHSTLQSIPAGSMTAIYEYIFLASYEWSPPEKYLGIANSVAYR